ncbi:MAG: hypothetical protein JHD16_00015 [Solirubrobacteraceae bacterium]|nr:hypothetical protein [Solirubrobacteraceae bacterium]
MAVLTVSRGSRLATFDAELNSDARPVSLPDIGQFVLLPAGDVLGVLDWSPGSVSLVRLIVNKRAPSTTPPPARPRLTLERVPRIQRHNSTARLRYTCSAQCPVAHVTYRYWRLDSQRPRTVRSAALRSQRTAFTVSGPRVATASYGLEATATDAFGRKATLRRVITLSCRRVGQEPVRRTECSPSKRRSLATTRDAQASTVTFAKGDGKKYGNGSSESSKKEQKRLTKLVARCDGNFIAGTNPGPWKSKRKWGTVRVQVLSRRGKVIKRPPRRQLESAEPGKYRFRYSWKLQRGWELCALRGGFSISIDEAGGDLFNTHRVYYPKPDKGSTPRRGIFVDPWASAKRRTTSMLVFVRRTG